MTPVISSNLSLKYQSFKPLSCKDIGIIKFEFVAKTQFLYIKVWNPLLFKPHNGFSQDYFPFISAYIIYRFFTNITDLSSTEDR